MTRGASEWLANARVDQLYHYTCAHGAAGIEQEGYVKSLFDILGNGEGYTGWLPPWGSFAWFTDLDAPQVEALGLTRHTLKCDRTAHRFRVTDSTEVERWLDVRRNFPRLWLLEEVPGAMPAHWWLATEPIPVVPS